MLCIIAFAEEGHEVPHVRITIAENGTWSSNKGCLKKEGSEYHLFTDKENIVLLNVKNVSGLVTIESCDNAGFLCTDTGLSQGCIERYKDSRTGADKKSINIHESYGLGIENNCESAKFKIGNTNLLIHITDRYLSTFQEELGKHSVKVNNLQVMHEGTLKNVIDTLHLNREGSFKLTLKRYRYTILREININEDNIYPKTESIENNEIWNDKELEQNISVSKLKKGANKLSVTYSLYDAETKDWTSNVTETYYLEVPKAKTILPIWLLVVIFVVVLTTVSGILIIIGIRRRANMDIKTEEKGNDNFVPIEDAPDEQVQDQSETIDKEENDLLETLNSKVIELETKIENQKEERKKLLDEILHFTQEKVKYDEFVQGLQIILELQKGDTETIKNKIEAILTELKDRRIECTNSQNNLMKTKNRYEKIILDLKEEHKKDIDDINAEWDKNKKKLQRDFEEKVVNKDAEIEELKKLVEANCLQIRDFYYSGIKKFGEALSIVNENVDKESASNSLLKYIVDDVNGFGKFTEDCDRIIKSESDMKKLKMELWQRLIQDLDYDLSWCNFLARLYAYSNVDVLNDIFGFYSDYKEEIASSWEAFVMMAARLGVEELVLPELFTDTYDSKLYNYGNTNLVLPRLFPDFAEFSKPRVIYDILTIGYKTTDISVKPMVVYF